MPNLTSLLNEQIRRLSAREITAREKVIRRLTAQHRRDIAALKRQVSDLRKTVSFLEACEEKRVGSSAVSEVSEAEGLRFRADGLRSHRAKLGLSAQDYGALVGVSGLTIYAWEAGKTKPRQAQLGKIASARGLGKREALKRLELMGVTKKRTRGSYEQTAEEFILSLAKGKGATSADINKAWHASGRRGKADNTLSLMVKKRQLKREKLESGRGSRYLAK